MSYKLSLEEIENGYLVTRSAGKIFRPNLGEAIREVRLAVDGIEREAKAEEAKASAPQPQPSKVAVPAR